MSQVCGQGLGIAVDMTHPRLTGDESTINITSCRIVPIKLGIMSDQNQECLIKVSFPRDNVRSKFFPYIPLCGTREIQTAPRVMRIPYVFGVAGHVGGCCQRVKVTVLPYVIGHQP